MTEYNYDSINQAFEALKGLERDELSYLDDAINLLQIESPRLAAYKGSLGGKRMILQTAKGRASYELTNEEVEKIFSEYEKAEDVLINIKEVVMLVKMKINVLKQQYLKQ